MYIVQQITLTSLRGIPVNRIKLKHQIYKASARPKTPTAPVNPTANAPVAAGAPPVDVAVVPELDPELDPELVAAAEVAPPVVAPVAVAVAAAPVLVTYAVYKYDLTLGGSEATQPGV